MRLRHAVRTAAPQTLLGWRWRVRGTRSSRLGDLHATVGQQDFLCLAGRLAHLRARTENRLEAALALDAASSAMRPEANDLRNSVEPRHKIICHCCDRVVTTKPLLQSFVYSSSPFPPATLLKTPEASESPAFLTGPLCNECASVRIERLASGFQGSGSQGMQISVRKQPATKTWCWQELYEK